MYKIVEVKTKKQLRAFIDFPFKLYENNPYWIPPLRLDEMQTLKWDKNPSFKFCKAKYWLAYEDDEIVGRIAGIINYKAIDKWGKRYARFGWFDFIDDVMVSSSLLQKVEDWARYEELDGIQGPMGFTDFDKEGMLVDGFDEMGTLTTQYNYSYYPKHMELSGYSKDVDWLEYMIVIPDHLNDNIINLSKTITQKYGLKTVTFEKAKEVLAYADDIFNLLNEAYYFLYNTTSLDKEQIDFYVKQYISVINPNFVKVVVDGDNKLAAFAMGVPSLAKAFRASKGKLFPLGFYRYLRALKKNDSVDLLLVAIRPDLQGKGVNSLLMKSMADTCWKNGIQIAYLNPQLEDNHKVRSQWKRFDAEQNKRRRCYIKVLGKDTSDQNVQ